MLLRCVRVQPPAIAAAHQHRQLAHTTRSSTLARTHPHHRMAASPAAAAADAAASPAASSLAASAASAAPTGRYVDAHTHLHFIARKLPAVANYNEFVRSFPAGYDGCVNVFCEVEDFKEHATWLAFDGVYGAFGVHPHNAKDYSDAVEAQLVDLVRHPKAVAWGECGLDYHYMNSPKETQKEVFARQCKAAVRCNRPLVVHTREAEEDTLSIMKANLPKDWRIHVHCFTSGKEFALALIEHFPNLCIGFTGVITFKNSTALRDTVAAVPLERILLETDGPYMAPVPHRGKDSHPGYIPLIAQQVATTKAVSLEQVLTATRAATRRVYGF